MRRPAFWPRMPAYGPAFYNCMYTGPVLKSDRPAYNPVEWFTNRSKVWNPAVAYPLFVHMLQSWHISVKLHSSHRHSMQIIFGKCLWCSSHTHIRINTYQCVRVLRWLLVVDSIFQRQSLQCLGAKWHPSASPFSSAIGFLGEFILSCLFPEEMAYLNLKICHSCFGKM